MKKILIILSIGVCSAVAANAQGLVSLSDTGSGTLISTNGSNVGQGTGPISGPNGSQYFFEVLDSTSTSLASTANQIFADSVNFALWTDSTVSGQNGYGFINQGKIMASVSGVNANNWAAAPNVAQYGAPDSYMVVGWSANFGSTWSAVSSDIEYGELDDGWYGTSAIGINVAGGNGNGVVNLWGNQTGIPGDGLSSGFALEYIEFIPEPATMALLGLGGLSLLALRRKK